MARQHTAWVIELKERFGDAPRFYTVHKDSELRWLKDIRKAVKFSTRDSARAIIRRERDEDVARPVEKQFG